MFKSVGKVVDLRDTKDAIEACGLDWNVYKGNVSHQKADGSAIACPRFSGVFRKDTDFNLGIVGADYSLVQNAEAASIADTVLEQDTKLRIIRGGEIFNGDKLFLNLRVGDAVQIGSEFFDRIIMIAWAHDGGLSVTARFFLIRKSTGAILNVDSPEIQTSIKIRHTGKTDEKIKIAQNILKAAYKFFENIESKMEVLAFTPMTDGDFKGMLSKIFPDSAKGEGKGQTRTQNKRDEVFGLYQTGTNSANMKGTKLGGLLAITEYCNGEKSTRVCKDKNPEEVELNGILFGTRTAEINTMFKGLLESMPV
jgi:phage/plasmid-like protein (TIGR03299 family)